MDENLWDIVRALAENQMEIEARLERLEQMAAPITKVGLVKKRPERSASQQQAKALLDGLLARMGKPPSR